MKNIYKINDNIYITSDEEIKDCWVLNTHTNEFYFLKYYYGTQPITKKIVLTTDQELIDDGVQPIDDDFLEWFVKNPSCESVDVNYELGSCLNCEWNHDMCPNMEECLKNKYMIIIPKEEPKQETLPDDLFYNLEPVQETFKSKELVIYNYAGRYRLGGENGLSIFFENKPKWLHRKMMKLCLGLEWINN